MADITYVPVTHESPPIRVEYEKEPEAMTVCVAKSSDTELPTSVTSTDTLSGKEGLGLIVPPMV